MGRAKEIIVKVIPSKIANEFVKNNHYSGKVAVTSTLHFGCFLDNILHGVLSFGNSIDKRKVLPLVLDSGWNEYLELNRMAFDSYLPKNSESRCISIAIMLIKKNAPHIKWILSYADACQCGDGAIYRASGFVLTQIKKNSTMWITNTGEVVAELMVRQVWNNSSRKKLGFNLGESWSDYAKRTGAKKLQGNQLRYIYLIDKQCKITVPIIPFKKITELGIGMYKGKLKQAAIPHLGEGFVTNEKGEFESTEPLKISS